MEPIQLDLITNTVPIVLKGIDGNEHPYEIREMSAAWRDKYLDRMGERVRIVDGKPAGLKRFDGAQADLLSLCLYHTITGENPKLVTKEEVQAWPASVVNNLFQQAQLLNELITRDDQSKKD